MLRLLVFLQVCHFLTAFPNRDANVQVCGPKLNRMISFVCKNRFQTTTGKKRSDTTLEDYNSFNDVEELSKWLEHEYYRTPDVPSKIRLADILPTYLSTSIDDTYPETTFGGLPHLRFRRNPEYVISGGLATECCHKSCTYATMLEFCA